MRAGYGGTLQGCTLVEGGAAVSSGIFKGANTIECVEDGEVYITWNSGNTQTIAYTSGWVNPVDCKQVEVKTGLWNIAKV